MKFVSPPEPPAPPAPPAPPDMRVSAVLPASPRRIRRDELLGIDPRVIYLDTLSRPEHYSEEQRALAETLSRDKTQVPKSVRPAELIDLVLTFFRTTALREAVRDIVSKATSPDTELDATFEDQDFGPTIRVI